MASSTQPQPEPIIGEIHAVASPPSDRAQNSAEPGRWTLATRIAFRFCVLYFGLFCFSNQVITSLFPFIGLPDPSDYAPLRPMVFWTAAHIFHVKTQLIYTGSGSGDKTFDWILDFCLLAIALLATLAWSALDHKRTSYPKAHKWFYLAIRFALGAQLLSYGMAKVVPLQMPFPFLSRLVEPYGNFSPMAVLWSSIGSSPAYEMFAGSAEALAGILLFFPRTAMLGAVIGLADMIEVFALNMTYDVPVKLFSFHLVLLSLLLLAPDLRRLARFFLSKQAVDGPVSRDVFSGRRANRISRLAQAVFGLLLISSSLYLSRQRWRQYGPGAPKPLLYGIWNIEPPLDSGYTRVVFENTFGIAFQKPDATFVRFAATFNDKDGVIGLKPSGILKVHRSGNQLTLDGDVRGQPLHIRANLLDRNSFMLVSRGFHWIQEYPFQR